MAFPIDARIRTYIAGMQIPSADLNAIQDAIIDNSEDRVITIVDAVSAWSTSDAKPAWSVPGANPQVGWEKVCGTTTDGILMFRVQGRVGMVIKELGLTYYNASGSPVKPDVSVYLVTSSVTPSLGSSIADMTSVADIAATTWALRSITGLTVQLAEYQYLLFVINTAATGDRVAGLNITIQP